MGSEWNEPPPPPGSVRDDKSDGEGCLRVLVVPVVALLAVLLLAGCPSGDDQGRPDEGTRCKTGQQWQDPDGDEVMACERGRWKLYRDGGGR